MKVSFHIEFLFMSIRLFNMIPAEEERAIGTVSFGLNILQLDSI